MSMLSKKKITFIKKLEFRYRNFGSEWRIDEILSKEDDQSHFLDLLSDLEKEGIIELKPDQKSFKILDLPTKFL